MDAIRIINLDMDGVTFNFHEHFFKTTGYDFMVYSRVRTREEAWSLLEPYKHNFYETMPAFEGTRAVVRDLLDLCSRYEGKVCLRFLSAKPSMIDIPNIFEQKERAIHTEIQHRVPLVLAQSSSSKFLHCTNPMDILIDDNEMNVDQWNSVGGVGFKIPPNFQQNAGYLFRVVRNALWRDEHLK